MMKFVETCDQGQLGNLHGTHQNMTQTVSYTLSHMKRQSHTSQMDTATIKSIYTDHDKDNDNDN